MRPESSHYRTEDDLKDRQTSVQRPGRYGWSRFEHIPMTDQGVRWERTETAVSQVKADLRGSAATLGSSIVSRNRGFALPNDKAITVSVIAGPSKGATHRLVKPIISVGRAGGGADMEIDDPSVSLLHCALGVRQDAIRLRDLDSTSWVFINDERVSAAEVEHLSEIRVGSSLLFITILPKAEMATT